MAVELADIVGQISELYTLDRKVLHTAEAAEV